MTFLLSRKAAPPSAHNSHLFRAFRFSSSVGKETIMHLTAARSVATMASSAAASLVARTTPAFIPPLASSPMLVDLCTNAAPLAAVLVFMAPFPTVQKIRHDKGVGTLPLLPYSSMVASAFLWTTYGILTKNPNVWSANVVGFVMGLYYMMSFIQNSPKAAPTLPGSVRLHTTSVLTVIVATLVVAMTPFLTDPASLIGPCGVLMTIGMFASPLSALKTVVQTRSAASIPLPFTLASLANCFFWSVAGLFRMKDANIYVPNLLGLSFSLAQVALKLVYGDGDGSKGHTVAADLPI